ncbi:MAG: hypothetical protein ACI9FO_000006 [Methylophagaceae bacterium]|jgi:hypothetical protein
MNRRMRNLYQSMGAAIALFVLLLSITGILLNHSSDLKLDKHYLTWPWLLSHYGVGNVQADAVFLLDQSVISQFGAEVFVNAKPVTNAQRPLLGGVVLDDMIVLATDDALILLNSEGEFIERMGAAAGVPPIIQNIGLFHGGPIIQTREGMWRSDFMLDKWELISLQGVGWSLPSPMPASIQKELVKYFHGEGVSAEQVLLDVHNGRILGVIGVWLLDLVGVLLTALSLTGIWMWLRRSQ